MNKFTGMIKATDLRIGNLILPKEGVDEHVTVTDIDEDGMIGTTAFFYDGKGTTGTVSEAAMGIPLTPEWLERCGYIEMEYVYSDGSKTNAFVGKGRRYIIRYFEHITETPYYGVEHFPYPQSHNCIPGELRYVHQLQNHYFAMTGEELTIKETV